MLPFCRIPLFGWEALAKGKELKQAVLQWLFAKRKHKNYRTKTALALCGWGF